MFTGVRELFNNKIKLICFFSIYSIIFYLPAMLIIGKGATIVGIENTHWTVACNVLCMGLGFISYPLNRKIFISIKMRRGVFLVLGMALLVYILILLGPLQTGNIASYLFMLGGEAFLMGHLSGYVFSYMAFSLQDSPYLGRIFGIAMAIGVFSQNILQHNMEQILKTAMLTVAITIVGMMLVLWKAPHDLVFDNALPYEKNPPAFPRQGALGVLTVLMLAVLSGLYDSYLTYLNAHEFLDEADWPRLFFAIGLVVAGFLADIGRHRYMALATACSSVSCIGACVMLVYGAQYNTALAMTYFHAGFFVLYLMVFFFELGPRTKEPALWVVMGRAVYCIVNGLMVLAAPQLRYFLTGDILIFLSTIVVIAIFILCYLQGQPKIQPEHGKEKVQKVPLNPLESFAASCNFTPREIEVFTLLTDDNLTIQDIADKLFISRRVCQRYLTSMYEKTATKNRLNLLLKYYRNNPQNMPEETKIQEVLQSKQEI